MDHQSDLNQMVIMLANRSAVKYSEGNTTEPLVSHENLYNLRERGISYILGVRMSSVNEVKRDVSPEEPTPLKAHQDLRAFKQIMDKISIHQGSQEIEYPNQKKVLSAGKRNKRSTIRAHNQTNH